MERCFLCWTWKKFFFRIYWLIPKFGCGDKYGVHAMEVYEIFGMKYFLWEYLVLYRFVIDCYTKAECFILFVI